MRIYKKIPAVLVTGILCVVLLLASVVPVMAAAVTVVTTLSQSIGSPSTAIYASAASGFTAGSAYTVYFNNTSTGVTGLVPNPTASFTTGYFSVPILPRGSYPVEIRVAGDTNSAIVPTFTITPQITSGTTSGRTGSLITVSGNGFAATNTIYIYFDGVALVAATSDALGQLPATAITVPSVAGGTHLITASDSVGYSNSVSFFAITPQITLSSATGTIGSQFTVTGSGFAINNTVTIYFDGVAQVTATTDYLGQLPSTTVTIPQSAGGAHAVTAADTGGYSNSLTFTITATMTLSATTGAVGSSITIAGNGFAASSPLSFYLDSNPLTTSVSTDSTGKFSTPFVIPATSAGTHVLEVDDSAGHSMTANISVTSAINTGATTGTQDTNVNVTGSGFTAGARISVTFDGTAITTVPAAIQVDANGGFTASFKVPATASGGHIISVSDGTNTKTSTFTTSPNPAKINVTSGPVGTSVTITGSGFKASATVSAIYNGLQVGTATSDTKGVFTVTFAIPPSSTGAHSVTVSDGTNPQQNFSFSVTPTADMSPKAPTTGHVGTSVTVTGNGFGASKSVTVKYDADQIAATTSDANGTFTASFQAPVSKGGNHTVTVSDGTNSQTFTFAMDSTPPPVPTLVLPADATRGDKIPTLSWSSVTDPSGGVTYNLQFSKDPTFNILIWQKTGLTATSYTFTQAETLKSASKKAPYYWRVQAVDAAANTSAWSTAFNFFVGFVMPSWGWYIIFGVLAVLLGVGGFFLGMRMARRV